MKILCLLLVLCASLSIVVAAPIAVEVRAVRDRPADNPILQARQDATVMDLGDSPTAQVKLAALQSLGTRAECRSDFLITNPPVCVIKWAQDVSDPTLLCSNRSMCEDKGLQLCNLLEADHVRGTSRNVLGNVCNGACFAPSVRMKITCQ